MIQNISIQLKAAFLLIVFGLNTVIGFACAVGADVNFISSSHHNEAPEVSTHVHANGKNHEHHQQPHKAHHKEKQVPKKHEHGCCNDDVLKFQSLDKSLDVNTKSTLNAPLFVAIPVALPGANILKIFQAAPQQYLTRNIHPPPADIRIAIRSFQI